MPLIEAERLAVRRDGYPAVRDVSLGVAEASWFGLIGANGSGKTSLLRAIGGRLPIHSGHCRIAGTDETADRAARARAIGFAPPGEALPDALKVRELLDIAGVTLAGLGPVRTALGLDSLLDRTIASCSAGMRQRVAIACAFAEGRRIVVLDEPFNWLDPVAAYDLRLALRAMVDNGLTLITALHDLRTLVSACDAGVLLGEGLVTLALDRETMAAAAADPAAFERRTIDLLRGQR
jgi:ABC-type multidrug transport system ATPase subunit